MDSQIESSWSWTQSNSHNYNLQRRTSTVSTLERLPSLIKETGKSMAHNSIKILDHLRKGHQIFRMLTGFNEYPSADPYLLSKGGVKMEVTELLKGIVVVIIRGVELQRTWY
jgi:hypothetical protein